MEKVQINEKTQRSIRLDKGIVQTIEKMAKMHNRTFNNMVETILLNEARQQQQ